ncbi:C40 family peptidase [Jeotgalibacillus proteolyticus]|uniref:C40 family peptidase n=1 Tax=Jeotgalibacillus proteolyticus TaxID=2082395 RepID=UPI003CE9753B
MFKRILACLLIFALVAAVAPSFDKASASGKTYYVNIDSGHLNFRKAATTSSAIIGKFVKGDTVTVHSQSKGWSKITAKGKTGYVSSQYISIKKASASTDYKPKAISAAKSQLGVRYLWGGMSSKGFDCSGLVNYAFAKAGKTLPRTSGEMYKKGTSVSLSSLKPGDLMFYATSGGKKVTHVSIYIGNGEMIHSASNKGVSIASINNSYWKQRYIGAKRL